MIKMEARHFFVCILSLNLIAAADIDISDVIKWIQISKDSLLQRIIPSDNSQAESIDEIQLPRRLETFENVLKGLLTNDLRFEQFSNAVRDIKLASNDLKNINAEGNDNVIHNLHVNIFKRNCETRNIMRSIDFVLELYETDDGVTEPFLDILEKKYRCNEMQFKEFYLSFLETCAHAAMIKSADFILSLNSDQTNSGDMERKIVNNKLWHQTQEKCKEAENKLSNRMAECRNSKYRKNIAEDIKHAKDSHELGEVLSERYHFLWIIITTFNPSDEFSFYVKPGSFVIKGEKTIIMFGMRNEIPSEKDLLDIKRVVSDVLNSKICPDEKQFVHCYTEAVDQALDNTGFVNRSLIGIFVETGVTNDEFNHQNDPSFEAAVVDSAAWTIQYCESFNAFCMFDYFNVLGKLKNKKGTFRIYVHAKKSDRADKR